jgi:hypothetical protein
MVNYRDGSRSVQLTLHPDGNYRGISYTLMTLRYSGNVPHGQILVNANAETDHDITTVEGLWALIQDLAELHTG